MKPTAKDRRQREKRFYKSKPNGGQLTRGKLVGNGQKFDGKAYLAAKRATYSDATKDSGVLKSHHWRT